MLHGNGYTFDFEVGELRETTVMADQINRTPSPVAQRRRNDWGRPQPGTSELKGHSKRIWTQGEQAYRDWNCVYIRISVAAEDGTFAGPRQLPTDNMSFPVVDGDFQKWIS